MKKLLVLMVAAMALVAFTAPAWAAAEATGPNVTVGGRMLTDFGYNGLSEEMTSSGDDVTSAFIDMPGHSYLRATFASEDKSTGGFIELGLKALQPEASVSLRYAYGWWKVGNCKILAGQTDNWFGSLAYHPRQYVGLNHRGHLLLFGWGLLWPHRVTQAQFTYDTGMWGVQFAIEDPRVKNFALNTVDPSTGATVPVGGTDAYFVVPRLSLTGKFRAGGFMTNPGVSWVRHDLEGAPAGFDDSYDTWAINLPFLYSTGAFTAKFVFHYGVNFATEYPFYPGAFTSYFQSPVDGKIEDTTIWGGLLTFEYKMGPWAFYIGGGYENFSNDKWNDSVADGGAGWATDENERYAFFVAVPYQVNKYFGIHPEFSYYDYGDNPVSDSDMGQEWILGVEFRFIFYSTRLDS